MVAGEIPAGRYVRLACERFLSDLALAEAGEGPWEFRPDLAEAAMLFAGLLPNIKGPEAGRPLRLMPWQRFVFANLFGFVERGTATRRFRQGVVFVPRGNGKTTLAGPIALYLTFVDGEGGAEGYAAAVTRNQACILFDVAQQMVRRSAGLRDHFAVHSDAIRAIMRQACNNTAQETAAKTRHLNIWVGADEALFSTRAWQAARDPALTLEARA